MLFDGCYELYRIIYKPNFDYSPGVRTSFFVMVFFKAVYTASGLPDGAKFCPIGQKLRSWAAGPQNGIWGRKRQNWPALCSKSGRMND